MSQLAAPQRYVVPRVHGDPVAVRRLAAGCRQLADALSHAQRRVIAIVHQVDGVWSGPARQASALPVTHLLRDLHALTQALEQVADGLSSYADRLEHAQHHHGFSLHKLVAIGAVVAVSAAAVVVTMGAAGAVEAAAAGAAVAEATEAAGTAAAAATAAAAGLADSLDLMASLRPLLSFVLPQLTQVEWSAAAVAAYDEATTGRLDWHEIGISAGLSFVGSGVAARAAIGVRTSRWVQAAPGLVRRIAPHAAESSVWAGVSAADDRLLTGQVELVDVCESFVFSGAGTAGREALRARGIVFHEGDFHYRRALLDGLQRPGRIVDAGVARDMAVVRSRAAEFEHGRVDLGTQEGPGHTLHRHVGRDGFWLRHRSRFEHRRFTSSYFDRRIANDTVNQVLVANRGAVGRWLADGGASRLTLRGSAPHDVGYVIDRRGTIRLARHAFVVLSRDAYGAYVLTSYPSTY